MVRLRLRERLKASFRFMVSPPPRLDPTARYPIRLRYAALIALLILLLEWYYFFVEAPYDTIPQKSIFWLAFLGWATPGIFVEWAYRNLPTKKLINKYANVMIAIGLVAITIGIEVKRSEALVPVAYALVPGFMAGALVGSDSLLIWRIINTRSSKTDGGHSARDDSRKHSNAGKESTTQS